MLGRIALMAGSFGLLVAMPTLARMTFATPEFEDGTMRPVSIAIIPPEAAVSTQRLVTSESLVEESTEFSGLFSAALAEALRGQGYTVEIVTPERVNGEPLLQQAVISAKSRNDELLVGVKKKEMERREYAGSDEARILADMLDVDAVGFASLTVVGATGGKKAMSILLGGSTGGSVGSLVLIGGDSGQIEAQFSGMGSGSRTKFEEDPETEIGEIVARMLQRLPDADPAARVDSTASEEELLRDLESLLGE